MKTTLAFFVVLVAAASAIPRSRRDAKDAAQPTQLTELITQAQTNINNLGKQIQEQLNLPDQETVVNTIKTQSTNFAEGLKGVVTKATEEIKAKSPEIEQLWEEVKTRLTKVADDINNQIPNAKEQAASLQAKLQDGIKVVVEESQKASKAFNENSGKVQEDIAKFTKQAVDLAVQTTQSLSDQLKKAADAPK